MRFISKGESLLKTSFFVPTTFCAVFSRPSLPPRSRTASAIITSNLPPLLPTLTGGIWTNVEDEILKSAISKYGKNVSLTS